MNFGADPASTGLRKQSLFHNHHREKFMFRKVLVLWAMLWAAAAFAAVDVNKATQAELDGVKGIGPAMSQRILDARKEGEFKSWDDFMARVKGVKDKTAERFSAEGLTIQGASFKPAAMAPKTGKPAAAK